MKKGAVNITAAAVILCLILLFAIAVSAPYLASLYAELRSLTNSARLALIWAFYLCALPAAVSLISLLKILFNIRRDQPFLNENSVYMSVVSWCCLAAAVFCGAAGIWYFPLFFITAAMIFLFLIIRIVRGCFISAIYLKEENSLTI